MAGFLLACVDEEEATVPQQNIPNTTALVLVGGGGARGAYEAGVISGIAEILASRDVVRPPVGIFTGSSMGAFNATWAAANAHRPLWEVGELLKLWHGMSLNKVLSKRGGAAAWLRDFQRMVGTSPRALEPDAFEQQFVDMISWATLRSNLKHGLVRALLLPAHDLGSAQTVIFSDLAEAVDVRPPAERDILVQPTEVGPDHVVASAALMPLLEPRTIDGRVLCDGGFRFPTPLAPAIWAGAERMIVVTAATARTVRGLDATPSLATRPDFGLGKMLNGMLLDPVRSDLRSLSTTNKVVAASRAAGATGAGRYRQIEALVFQPSRDPGVLASEVLEDLRRASPWRQVADMMLGIQRAWQGDLYSYALLDERYTRALTALGRNDAFARAEEILRFFRDEPSCETEENRLRVEVE